MTTFPKWGRLPTPVSHSSTLDNSDYDSLVVVASEINEVKRVSEPIFSALQKISAVST
jgi:hypothetical protein